MIDIMERAGLQTDARKIIKVVGVGGGGGNAVTHMYQEGIEDVSFVLCNTDKQALMSSEVPVKIVLGPTVTGGLGAGNNPERARDAAVESADEMREMLNDGTKMVFITAGMGGGTGTGAAPVIASIAKEMGILTVGIVTIPFLMEGESKIIQALNGVEEMSKNVDALLVVNNDRLIEVFPDDTLKSAFKKADNILAIAAKSISEIITISGEMNVDFADVQTTMENSGVALMSNGYGEGEERLEDAIEDALQSPLMNNNDVFNAKKILFNIYCSHDCELRMKEFEYVENFMARFRSGDINVIYGWAYDDSLKGKIKFTIIASGFGLDDIPELKGKHAADKERTEEEKRQKYKELIEKYYGKHSGKKPVIRSVSRASIIVLALEEMDDDKIISILEDNPTYNRDPKLIIQARSKTARKTSGNTESSSSGISGRPVIKF
jgi:cell division protein FtsZ